MAIWRTETCFFVLQVIVICHRNRFKCSDCGVSRLESTTFIVYTIGMVRFILLPALPGSHKRPSGTKIHFRHGPLAIWERNRVGGVHRWTGTYTTGTSFSEQRGTSRFGSTTLRRKRLRLWASMKSGFLVLKPRASHSILWSS